MKIKKYILETAVFICGAVVMIFELLGSRVLGPYFGTSIFVWTSLIGVILASLSLGYYIGGKMSDKQATLPLLSLIILFASITIVITLCVKDILLLALDAPSFDIRFTAIFSSLVLFSPTSLLLGMVSPYAAKLKLDNIENTGSTIGNLSALSTSGSIFGTFVSGFFLIPHFGTNVLFLILSIFLLVTSLVIAPKSFFKLKLFVLCINILGFFVLSSIMDKLAKNNFFDIDTAYNRVWIYDFKDQKTGKPAKVMGINNENHSSMFLESEELVNEYTKYYHLARHFFPNFKHTLMLGGAAYSYPKDFLTHYPDATIDVVEIDPKLTEMAREYFRLVDHPHLTIYHEDGRVFLNQIQKKYDVLFGDAFTSHYSVPYQLTTKEAVQKKYDILNDGGVVILNIISSIEGKKGQFLRAEYGTYKSVFPQVYILPVNSTEEAEEVQNIILVAVKSSHPASLESDDTELNEFLSHVWKKTISSDMPLLTDDFAPVDSYISKAI